MGAMPGRSPYEVRLSTEERAELEHRAACYTRPHREVLRAKLVLMAADGETNTEIGERLGMSREAVGRWRRRFCEERLEGLEDKARSGRPRRFPPGGSDPSQGGRLRAPAHRGRPALALLAG
jgi:transposase-like protein